MKRQKYYVYGNNKPHPSNLLLDWMCVLLLEHEVIQLGNYIELDP